ncbi:MAG: hypothetical protein KAH07_08230 [Flavobacteriaceae bacterium]|nr:hypothetical protein [Flavobacteriaceae bacterium]
MLQRLFLVLILGSSLVSCEFFQKKQIGGSQLIDTIIDFNSVDMFPLFPDCEGMASQEKQRVCTQIKLSEHLFVSLQEAEIVTLRRINDTVYLKLKVNELGEISLVDIKTTAKLNQQIPKIDSLILDGVQKLPNLKPAIKRGIPVATELTLSIVVVN